MCQLHDVALNRYIMELTDEFKSQGAGNLEGKLAASCHGLNGNVWILNESVQIDRFGNQLAQENTKFVWLGNFISRDGVVPKKYQSSIATPLDEDAIKKVLHALSKCLGNYKNQAATNSKSFVNSRKSINAHNVF